MDFTMFLQMSRKAHVEAALRDDEELQQLQKALVPSSASVDDPALLSDLEEAKYLAQGTMLSVEHYNALGTYLELTERQYLSVYSLQQKATAPLEARFLPPRAHKPYDVLLDGRTFSTRTSHEGNSAVQYTIPSTQELTTGNIEEIWQLPLNRHIHTFFVIRAHRPLPQALEQLAPFARFRDIYATHIVDCEPANNIIIVEPQHIRTHLSVYQRPAGTYGIPQKTLVVCWALNRGRR